MKLRSFVAVSLGACVVVAATSVAFAVSDSLTHDMTARYMNDLVLRVSNDSAPNVLQGVVIDTKPLIEQLVPYIVAAAGGIITTLGLLITAWLKQKWNIDIDAHRRDELVAAVRNVAAGAIAQGAVKVEDSGKITLHPGVLASITQDVLENRAPDAVAHFELSPQQVSQKIVEQLPQILNAGTASATTPIPVTVAVADPK